MGHFSVRGALERSPRRKRTVRWRGIGWEGYKTNIGSPGKAGPEVRLCSVIALRKAKRCAGSY